MIEGITTRAQFLANLQTRLAALRQAMNDAGNVTDWANSQSGDDLVALGFTAEEIPVIQSTCGNVAAIIAHARGGPVAPQMDYVANALQLIGPQ